MKEKLRLYEDCLHYLPEKERKAAKEALYLQEDGEVDGTESLIKQLNRRRAKNGMRAHKSESREPLKKA